MDEEEYSYIVYNDGMAWRTFDLEEDAIACVRLYDGDHHVWYEKVDSTLQ